MKVCDAIMGSGKTMAAITEMNERTDTRFVFVTPYLDEVHRICVGCEGRRFVAPDADVCGTKLRHFKSLVRAGRNVACSHALFRDYDAEAVEDIASVGYTLILDESIAAMEVLPVGKKDVCLMLASGLIQVDERGRVIWADDEYDGAYSVLREPIDSGYVTLEEGRLLLWMLPLRLFEAFDEVIILTYLFEAQPLHYYFKSHDVHLDYIGTKKDADGTYRFAEYHADQKVRLPQIHILEDKKLNSIGDKRTALSVGWYQRASNADISRVAKNMYNALRHRFGGKSVECLWTTYVDYRRALNGRGYSKGYSTWNMRATNKWSDRTCLAYLVNVFPHPSLGQFFASKGITLDQDAWALSEMVQWIWRSAIRRGEEIWIYVPSSRMRGLLKKWIKEVSIDPDEQDLYENREQSNI